MKLSESFSNRAFHNWIVVEAIRLLMSLFVILFRLFSWPEETTLSYFFYRDIPGLLIIGLLPIPLGMFYGWRMIKSPDGKNVLHKMENRMKVPFYDSTELNILWILMTHGKPIFLPFVTGIFINRLQVVGGKFQIADRLGTEPKTNSL
jgi:hypothetical protein